MPTLVALCHRTSDTPFSAIRYAAMGDLKFTTVVLSPVDGAGMRPLWLLPSLVVGSQLIKLIAQGALVDEDFVEETLHCIIGR